MRSPSRRAIQPPFPRCAAFRWPTRAPRSTTSCRAITARCSGEHTVAAGVSYDLTRVLKYYAFTLQPNNYLAPILTPSTPNAPATVVDDSPNLGNTYQSYLQDSWRMGQLWQADYGMRYDFFTIKSTGFGEGFGAFSPRLKLTRYSGAERASTPTSAGFSSRFRSKMSARTRRICSTCRYSRRSHSSTSSRNAIRSSSLAATFRWARAILAFAFGRRMRTILIDDTQVGVTLLHQDINYVLGRLSQEALTYSQPLPFNGRAYFSFAHVISLNSGCETQLLAPCFGQPTGFTPADHEQRYTVTSGILSNDRRGGWFSADGYYGSGLSSAFCPPATPGYCKETPHTIFDVEDGIPIAPKGSPHARHSESAQRPLLRHASQRSRESFRPGPSADYGRPLSP